MISRRVGAMALVGAVAAGLPSATLGQSKAEFALPPFAGAYEPQGVDERGLWMDMDEVERGFRYAPAVLQSPVLTQYVHGVLCRAVGTERCASVRTYIIKDSAFNASMSPNGLMIVNTGLLARVHSESELAAVLGHEFGHFEKRHSLYNFRQLRRTSDFGAWIGLAGAMVGTPTGNIQNALIFGYYSFNRAQESEADVMSVEYLKKSPYRLRASQIWQRLNDEQNALRQERGLRKLRKTKPDLFDTHPAIAERISFNAKAESETGEKGEDGVEAYNLATAPFLVELFEPLVRDNDFGAADYVLRARGDALGWNAQLYFLRGELYRLRGNPRDFQTARGFFEHAVTMPDAPAEAWRGLGLCALRMSDTEKGHAALKEYLKRKPAANDSTAVAVLLGS